MKDTHITLRISAEVARELERVAAKLGIAKSSVVREAVSQYLATPFATSLARPLTGAEFAKVWSTGAHLTPEEAEEFETELRRAREELPPLDDPWA